MLETNISITINAQASTQINQTKKKNRNTKSKTNKMPPETINSPKVNQWGTKGEETKSHTS